MNSLLLRPQQDGARFAEAGEDLLVRRAAPLQVHPGDDAGAVVEVAGPEEPLPVSVDGQPIDEVVGCDHHRGADVVERRREDGFPENTNV